MPWVHALKMTKREQIAYFDRIADERAKWKRRNRFYYDQLDRLIAFLVPPGKSVLEIGCATGDTLARVKPAHGVGFDLSERMIRQARARHPELSFFVGDAEAAPLREKFDYIIISNLIGHLSDIWKAFRELRALARPDTRIVVTYYNFVWEPILNLGEKIGLRMPQPKQNWLGLYDMANLLELNGFEVVKKGTRLLFPKYLPLISSLLNRYLGRLPLLKELCLISFVVGRQKEGEDGAGFLERSVSVVVPTRNEAGNVEAAVERIPEMGTHTEIIFVDGNSTDGTVEKIEELIARYRGVKDIKLLHQVPRTADDKHPNRMLKLGKGDAVRKAFDAASGEVLMILDSDLTVAPEDLPKFYHAIAEGRGELVNGTRLVYPMEKQAMRFLNLLGNKLFSWLFSWLLERPIKDTLCGTKVISKQDYERIRDNRAYFGDFDPYGDFDLLFGAAKLNMKIVEMPVRYHERTYGKIKIQRFRHGLMLLGMSWVAFRKLKLS